MLIEALARSPILAAVISPARTWIEVSSAWLVVAAQHRQAVARQEYILSLFSVIDVIS
jgi:hypothetical protein